jgi:Arc/MetJ family transcription regulator
MGYDTAVLPSNRPSNRQDVGMAKRKTTVYIDDEVLRATKVLAARTGRREYEIVGDALRSYLGLEAVESVWRRSQLSEEQAEAVAYGELHAMRDERDARGNQLGACGFDEDRFAVGPFESNPVIRARHLAILELGLRDGGFEVHVPQRRRFHLIREALLQQICHHWLSHGPGADEADVHAASPLSRIVGGAL